MRGILVQIQPLDPTTGTRLTVRYGLANNTKTLTANGSSWQTGITRAPLISMDYMDVDFAGRIKTGQATLQIDTRGLISAGVVLARKAIDRLIWKGAPISIWSGDGKLTTDLVPVFNGLISSAQLNRMTRMLPIQAEVNRRMIDVPLLNLEYGGGGGSDGDVEFRGTLKPACFGNPVNVEVFFFDVINNVGQIDAYGNVTAINNLYEDAASFGAKQGDYASYAALVAAVLAEGQWATCVAQGMIRLGAEPRGVITCDPVAGTGTPGAMMLRWLQTHAGVTAGNIDATTFTALDAALAALLGHAAAVSFWTQSQEQVLSLMETMCASCNSVPMIRPDGKIAVSRQVSAAAAALTINRIGGDNSATDWRDFERPEIWWRLKSIAAISWRVHTKDEIDYNDDLKDMGDYDNAEVYRQGMIVRSPTDGIRYLFINAVPSAGHAPPNAVYWDIYEDAPDAAVLKYVDGTPIEALKPEEAGANVTETNTAAAIAGQGALATENAADWGTQVDGLNKPADNAGTTVTLVKIGTASWTFLLGNGFQVVPPSAQSFFVGVYTTDVANGAARWAGRNRLAGSTLIFGLQQTSASATTQDMNLDWGFYQAGAGTLQTLAGDNIATPVAGVSATANTVLAVEYDGTKVRWYVDGVLKRTADAAAGMQMRGRAMTVALTAGFSELVLSTFTQNNWSAFGGTGLPEDNATRGENTIRNPFFAADSNFWALTAGATRVAAAGVEPSHVVSTVNNAGLSQTGIPLPPGTRKIFISYDRQVGAGAVNAQIANYLTFFRADGAVAQNGAIFNPSTNDFGNTATDGSTLKFYNKLLVTTAVEPVGQWATMILPFVVPLDAVRYDFGQVYVHGVAANNEVRVTNFRAGSTMSGSDITAVNPTVGSTELSATSGDNLVRNSMYDQLDAVGSPAFYSLGPGTSLPTYAVAGDPSKFLRMTTAGQGFVANVSLANTLGVGYNRWVGGSKILFLSARVRRADATGLQLWVTIMRQGGFVASLAWTTAYPTTTGVWQRFRTVMDLSAYDFDTYHVSGYPAGASAGFDLIDFRIAQTELSATLGADVNSNIIDSSTGGTLVPRTDLLTTLGIAAGIAGQGALATQSSADYATQVSGTTKPEANATQTGVGDNELKDDWFGQSWTKHANHVQIVPTATAGYAVGNEPFALELTISNTTVRSSTGPKVPVEPNTRTFFSIRAQRGTNASGQIVVVCDWLDASGAVVGSLVQGPTVTAASLTAGAVPKEYQWSAVSPATATHVRHRIYSDALGTTGHTFRLESPRVTKAGMAATAYGLANVAVNYDSTGTTADPGQLPFNLDYTVALNGVAQTAGVTYSWSVIVGGLNGLTSVSGTQAMTSIASGVGTLTVASLQYDTTVIEVTATANGASDTYQTTITKVKAAPPAGGGGGGGGYPSSQTSAFVSLAAPFATFANLLTSRLQITMPAGKTTAHIVIALSPRWLPKDQTSWGPWNVEFKIQRNTGTTGSPVWTDIGAVQNSNPDPFIDMVDNEFTAPHTVSSAGTMNYTFDDTGRTAGSIYEYQVLARVSSGTTTSNTTGMTYTGSVTLTAP